MPPSPGATVAAGVQQSRLQSCAAPRGLHRAPAACCAWPSLPLPAHRGSQNEAAPAAWPGPDLDGRKPAALLAPSSCLTCSSTDDCTPPQAKAQAGHEVACRALEKATWRAGQAVRSCKGKGMLTSRPSLGTTSSTSPSRSASRGFSMAANCRPAGRVSNSCDGRQQTCGRAGVLIMKTAPARRAGAAATCPQRSGAPVDASVRTCSSFSEGPWPTRRAMRAAHILGTLMPRATSFRPATDAGQII